MEWLVILSAGLFIWSIAALIDRYALLKRVKHKVLYVTMAASAHLVFAMIILFVFPFQMVELNIAMLAMLAGLFEAILLYFLYVAVSSDEISRVFPLSTMTAFLTLLLSWWLLDDPLVGGEWMAFFLFVVGGFFLAFRFSRNSFDVSRALWPILIAGMIGSFEVILLKSVFAQVPFWTGFVLSRLGLAVGGAFVFIAAFRKMREWVTISPRFRLLLVANQFFAACGHVFIYKAIQSANVGLVQSASAIQHLMVFILATFVSWIRPGIIGEDLRRKELVKKAVGVVFIVLAVFSLQSV